MIEQEREQTVTGENPVIKHPGDACHHRCDYVYGH
jgi:hypothetical protein